MGRRERMDARLCHQETNGEEMKILKALWETFKWALSPTCDPEAGVHVCGQGRKCKHIIKKDGVEIERKNV